MVKLKKISVKSLLLYTVPPLVILLATIITITAAMLFYADSMDVIFGRGERVVVPSENTADWDTEYYHKQFSAALGEEGSRANGARVTKQIADEGIVLMKNDGVLPLVRGENVTPFGYRYIHPIYGGTGSGNTDVSEDYGWSAADCLKKYFKVNLDAEHRLMDSVPVQLTATSADKAFSEEDGDTEFAEASNSIYEFESSVYSGIEQTFENTVGVVFIGRIGGEGSNIPHEPFYMNRAPHALALSDYEKEAIAVAKRFCKAVVVVLNTSNTMEIAPLMEGEYEADAIIWIGGPGSMGFDSLADIMCGVVNPSGRTVDIWERDMLSNPVMSNYKEQLYTNTSDICIAGKNNRRFPPGVYFLEYEEGIYYGYRYYETAAVMDSGFAYGSLDSLGGTASQGAVTYPFGYGLSYTSFEQRITDFSDDGEEIIVTVEVKNTGGVDGKEVVQLYYSAPYTQTDRQYGIEKAAKNLAVFKKVSVEAGESVTVKLGILKEDMASYCYTRANEDGTVGSYFLEEGTYRIILGKNSHEEWDSCYTSISEGIWYSGENLRSGDRAAQSELDERGRPLDFPACIRENKDADFVAATNQFQDSSDYMNSEATIFSRADWKGTFPKSTATKALSEERVAECSNFDPYNDPVLGMDVPGSATYTEEAPTSGADSGLKLSDMRGVGYYDEMWNTYLDQIDYSEETVIKMIFSSRYSTAEVECIGKVETTDLDGSHGIKITGASDLLATCAYCTEVVLASTWNTALAYAYGEAVGQECLTLGVNGWYAPALNVHRSPFGGRNFEYYSEDPLILGKMAAACVSGAASQGTVCYIKHFGMNEFEDKAINTCCWATEQTIREVYLRGFEIVVKEARANISYIADGEGNTAHRTMRACTAVMAAGTLMGAKWAAADYNLLNNVLRTEWGFQGVVTTDIAPQATPNVAYKCIFAGSDLRMSYNPGDTSIMNTAAGKAVARRAVKNICYAYANSNVTNGLAPGSTAYYAISPWKVGLIIANVAVYAVIISVTAFVVWYILKQRRRGL